MAELIAPQLLYRAEALIKQAVEKMQCCDARCEAGIALERLGTARKSELIERLVTKEDQNAD